MILTAGDKIKLRAIAKEVTEKIARDFEDVVLRELHDAFPHRLDDEYSVGDFHRLEDLLWRQIGYEIAKGV